MPAPFIRHSEVDVLIIGAGPAGLMCANALANARVDVRIVDQRASKVTTGQGDGISPRTTEVLQSSLLRESCQLHLVAFYNPSSTGGIEFMNRTSDVTAPVCKIPIRGVFIIEQKLYRLNKIKLALNQGAIQDIFLDSMTPLGVEVELSTIPTSIELSKDENELTDPMSYPEEIVHAKFVVGGDGAHSWIRKQFDVMMDGEQSGTRPSYVLTMAQFLSYLKNKIELAYTYVQLEDKDFINPVTGRPDKNKVGPEQILEVSSTHYMISSHRHSP
ncbi:FAD binding domain-containing protein [Suillus subluteus]|nr:FAD binding domain-containing protein [Suillus subluteus]